MRWSGDLAGVLQPVGRADRDIGRLVLVEHDLLVAAVDLGGAVHHHPMLGAVMMHLERELAAGFDGDVLHLNPVAGMDRTEGCPRAGARSDWPRLRARLALEALPPGRATSSARSRLATMSRVGGRDHDQVLDAQGRPARPCSERR